MTKHTDAGHRPKSKAASVSNASSQSKEAKRPEERRTLLANNEASQATAELSGAIRRNPVAAVGIGFMAGFVLALLTRG